MPDPGARTETLHTSPRAAETGELAPGSRLGRFVIERTIGAGGMGTVFEARDPDLDRPVAIKVLHAGTDDRARQQRLLQEARAIARLRHPNVVVVHEVGEHEGRLFIVMEMIEGPSLRDWLAAGTHASADIVRVLASAAHALAYAHRQRITHRDFKPENLMIDAGGVAKVVDFGIAELDSGLRGDGVALAVTQTGEAAGTPPYMAPEQLRGEAATPACDQFSWCITLYEALVGARPQRDLAAIAAGAAPPAIEVPGTLPARVRAILARGLAGDPAARFATMEDLLRVLEPRASSRAPWILAGAGTVGLAIAAIAAVSARAEDPCDASAARMAAAWSAAAHGQLGASLGAFAPRVAQALDERAAHWRASHAAVCRAPATPQRAHRMACLDDALAATRAFVAFWGARASDVPALRAVSGATSLADPRACELVEPIAGEAPRTPAEEALFARLQQASVARSANAFERSVAIAHEVADAARALGSDRVFARARIISGDALGFLLKLPEGERELREAIDAAARSKDDRLAAGAWGTLIVHIGMHERKPAEALSLATGARAAVARLGRTDREVEARLHLDLGRVMSVAHDFAGARAELEAAAAIVDAPPPQADRLVGEVHFELATALKDLGDPALRPQLLAHYARALEAQRRAYGDQHPAVAQTLQFLGVDRGESGDLAGGLELVERAIAAYTASVGPDHPLTGGAIGDAGTLLAKQGKFDAALVNMRRDAAIMLAAYGPAHPITISSRGRVGVLLRDHGDLAAGIAALEEAVRGAEDPADGLEEQLELGRAYGRANRITDARATLGRARQAAQAAEDDGDAAALVTAIDAELAQLGAP